MADAAGARLIVPVHHQSFRLSNEPFMEPIERIQEALAKERDRLALREIGETSSSHLNRSSCSSSRVSPADAQSGADSGPGQP